MLKRNKVIPKALVFLLTIIVPIAVNQSVAVDDLHPSQRDTSDKIAPIADTYVQSRMERAKAPPQAPNIVLIMLDDVGFGDTSTFGGLAQTPVLDRLAAEGLRYNRFHTTALCATTRAALLSGRNHHRVGYGGFGGIDHPSYDGLWKKSTASLAEVLKRNGYSTAAFGKWHNTPFEDISPIGPFDRWPTGLGFEYFYGNLIGESSQWEPPLWRNTEMVAPPARPEQGYHFTTDITDEAIHWVRTHESLAPGQPYFVYFATAAAHVPHHVPADWADRYRGKFDQGWDKLRAEVFTRQKKLGVIPANAVLTPRPNEVPAWDSLSAEQRRLYSRQMEVYAGFIAHTDHEIGRLIDVVKEGSRAENTLILFVVGDNGAMLLPGAAFSDSQLQRVEEVGGLESPLLSSQNKWVNYAGGWAWMGNTPFPRAKGWPSHFGGTRNPLVVSWPAGIKSRGELRSQFSHVIDIAATVYEAAGIEFPASVDGAKQVPLDGVSLVGTFDQTDAPEIHRTQYFETSSGIRAIYHEGWMASAVPDRTLGRTGIDHDFDRDRWELYHVADDFSQAADVATRYPQKLAELQTLFDVEARRNGVYPLGPGRVVRAPEWAEGRKKFVFHEGFPTVFRFPGSPTASPYETSNMMWDFSQPHRITARVTIPQTGANGSILAWGSRHGGVILYATDNRLIYENNIGHGTREFLVSSKPLPIGSVDIAVERESDGTGRLYIEGQLVAEKPLSTNATHWFEGVFEIGKNTVSQISDAGIPPFEFSGVVQELAVELK